MLDWLKQLGGNKSLKNTAGLEKESLDLLVEDFAALDKLQSGFSVKVIRYLVDAEGDEVLAELAGTTGAGEALGIGQQVFMMATRANLTPREKFFEQVKHRMSDSLCASAKSTKRYRVQSVLASPP